MRRIARRVPPNAHHLLVLGSLLALIQCQGTPASSPAAGPEPPIGTGLWAFAGCIECRDGELAGVVAMGNAAIPALGYFLLHGPPDTTVARHRAALSGPFTVEVSAVPTGGRGTGRSTGVPPTSVVPPTPVAPTTQTVVPPPQVVDQRVEDYMAVYRMRSSIALGLIGGDSARRVLCAGKAMQFRPDVARMIDSALVLLSGTCP